MVLVMLRALMSVKGTVRVPYRIGVTLLLAAVPFAIAGCGDANSPAKRQLDAVRGAIDTSYPGPADETLTDEQRTRLRERGNMQR